MTRRIPTTAPGLHGDIACEPIAKAERADDGFTLVELLVYAMLLGVVLVMVGSMLISGLRTQNVVIDATAGSQISQVVSKSVGQGIRNATAFSVATVGVDGDQVLRARVGVAEVVSGTTTITWQCQAWYYVKSTQSIYFAKNTAGLVPLPATTAPMPSGWLQLGTGITPHDALGPFTGSGTALTLAFTMDAGAVPDVKINTVYSVRTQNDLTTGPTTCF